MVIFGGTWGWVPSLLKEQLSGVLVEWVAQTADAALLPSPPGREAASGQSWLLMDVSLTAALKGGVGGGAESRGPH